jgi:hypothetical protein
MYLRLDVNLADWPRKYEWYSKVDNQRVRKVGLVAIQGIVEHILRYITKDGVIRSVADLDVTTQCGRGGGVVAANASSPT